MVIYSLHQPCILIVLFLIKMGWGLQQWRMMSFSVGQKYNCFILQAEPRLQVCGLSQLLVFSAVICWVIYELPCFLFNKPCAITEYRWSSFHQKQSWRWCWGGHLCKEVTGVWCPWRDALDGLWNTSPCGCAAVESGKALLSNMGHSLLRFWLCSL